MHPKRPITLTHEQVALLAGILREYLEEIIERGPISEELKIYRYGHVRLLVRRLEAKVYSMADNAQRKAKISFPVEHVCLLRNIIAGMPYNSAWQPILNEFDRAAINMIPVLPVYSDY